MERAGLVTPESLSIRGCNGRRSTTEQWMVLHTRSRQEKALARQLDAAGKRLYLPLVKHTTIIRGKRMYSHVPLFPGYLFLFGEREDGFDAIETKRVCQIIEIADQDRFATEIEQIARALDGGAELDRHPFAVEGRRCRIIRGPFVGLEGVIINASRRTRLVLQVEILGQGASLEIEPDLLEPLE